jgi:hypothetical protein
MEDYFINEFIELKILNAVRELLTGKVNELLGDMPLQIPFFEFSDYKGGAAVVPVVALSSCERNEKERLLLIDAYSLSITFNVPETADVELFCYAYAAAIGRALYLNPTLGGIADRVLVTGKKYIQPKTANCGQDWQVVFNLRITIEGNTYVG